MTGEALWDALTAKLDALDERGLGALIGAVLLEANDEWQLQHRYMQIEGMAAIAIPTIEEAQPLQITPKAA